MANDEIKKALAESGLKFTVTNGSEPAAIDTGIVACRVGTNQTSGCIGGCEVGCYSTGCYSVDCVFDQCVGNLCTQGRCTSNQGCWNWIATFV